MIFQQIKSIIQIPKKIFLKYKLKISVLVVLGFISGLLESIGISALIPLFSFIVHDGSFAGDPVSQYMEKIFSFVNVHFTLWTLLAFMAALFFFKAIVLLVFGYMRTKIIVDFETSTQRSLYGNMLHSNWPYLLRQKIGHLENTLSVDVLGATALLKQVSGFILDFTTMLVYSIVAFAISFPVTVMAFLIGALFLFLSKPLFLRTKRYAAVRLALNKSVTHHVNENVLGLKTIKALNIEKDVSKAGGKFFEEMRKIKMRQYLAQNILATFVQPLTFIFIIGVFAFSYAQAGFNIAGFIAVIYLIQRIFGDINNIQRTIGALVDSVPYVQKVLQVQEETEKNREEDKGKDSFSFGKALRFNHVGFSYDSGKEILADISFAAEKGKILAIIGPSGAGKTTIVDLLLRFFDPSRGEIQLDGKNIVEIRLSEWRRNIGYVSQDMFLKNDTIANNIRFYDPTISDEDIVQVTKLANIYDVIQTLPQKFETSIGDRGIFLSNGQRQRIVLARILARRPKILLLDEATSALDNESEALIRKAIEGLRGEMTIIVIAHRLSTVMGADSLIVLDHGKIVEEGNPEELLKNEGSYFSKMRAAA
jgi:ABC-type multidrug transport system fused ATPase/permease subunit